MSASEVGESKFWGKNVVRSKPDELYTVYLACCTHPFSLWDIMIFEPCIQELLSCFGQHIT